MEHIWPSFLGSLLGMYLGVALILKDWNIKRGAGKCIDAAVREAFKELLSEKKNDKTDS